VTRLQKALLLIAGIAIPAAAHSAFAPKESETRKTACFASGAATYRIAPDAAAPDYRIRIDGKVARADLQMRLVDRAEMADFVLVDDFSGAASACRSSTRIRTVQWQADTELPDVTVRLTADPGPADYTLYVHSARFSQQDAAALLAAIWKTQQRRELASGAVR
jgi:hypothetical protein